MSRNLVPDPEIALNLNIYSQLIRYGFRRSGSHCYRPHCRHCQQCIPCRVPVRDFQPSRSQKRCLKQNTGLVMSMTAAKYTDEYFDLYRRYLNTRHDDSSMANPAPDDFEQFLYSGWSDTQFIEFRLDEALVAVAVTDFVSDGASAVYSFFEPGMQSHGLGTYCILKQIEFGRRLSLDYLYLGYWIKDHPKMDYKARFQPLQIYRDERWQACSD
jgi:arginyl-tRNA--protein-N-Asp/Glu arginylyltransferase